MSAVTKSLEISFRFFKKNFLDFSFSAYKASYLPTRRPAASDCGFVSFPIPPPHTASGTVYDLTITSFVVIAFALVLDFSFSEVPLLSTYV